VWNEPERAQALGKERSALEAVVETIDQLTQGRDDVTGLLELAVEADDEETFEETIAELDVLTTKLELKTVAGSRTQCARPAGLAAT